ncbi:Frigida-like protein [Artemisia annua]|uniref:FRIGIDA-like protein n=1 Tax=Artemisia annua TaxID=35608 RepID=A0A2U1L9N0_ARTAN|nr:Frigida-like protein [Artemisia annua]
MAAISSGGGASIHAPDFDEFQRQASLMTSCTLLWKELSDHFESLEEKLMSRSDVIKGKIKTLEMETEKSLSSLEERESTIEKSVSIAMRKVEEAIQKAKDSIGIKNEENNNNKNNNDCEEEDFYKKLKCFCVEMDSEAFWGFICGKKKEIDFMRENLPLAFNDCVDPAMFVLDAFSEVFPVDKRTDSGNGNDLGWACVLLLESLVPVLVDPVLGSARAFVTPGVKKRAMEVAETWKASLDERGGVESVKASEVHTFLQHLVTFGIAKDEDFDLYWKLVVGSAWRKQMPKLAVSLGLGDKMPDMIKELISRGQQVDAVHFTQEVGLVDMFPPVPLLKAFLKDAKKAATSIMEDPNNSGRAAHLAARKEQSALRVVIKCIEEYKLEAEFPSENLKKRLEQLEKVKVEKKSPAAATPANKRTRACTMGPMPPAKAGRIANTYVSSFPAPPPTYVRSPQHTQYHSPPYAVQPQMYGHGNTRSPPANHYAAYSPEHSPVLSYPSTPPMNYPPPGGYMGYGGYQQAYYR